MWRSKGELITANIEFIGGRPFAVLYEYGIKGAEEIIKPERVALDPALLEKMDPKNGAEYLYKGDPIPDPNQN